VLAFRRGCGTATCCFHATVYRCRRGCHHPRQSRRAVCFPWSDRLTGTRTVADVLSGSVIDRVRVVSDAAPGAVLITRNHLRPTWSDGLLVLATEIAAGEHPRPDRKPRPHLLRRPSLSTDIRSADAREGAWRVRCAAPRPTTTDR